MDLTAPAGGLDVWVGLCLSHTSLIQPINFFKQQIDIISTLGAAATPPSHSESGSGSTGAPAGNGASSSGTDNAARGDGAAGSWPGGGELPAASGASAPAAAPPEPPAGCAYPCWWRLSAAADPVAYIKRLGLEGTKQLWREYVGHARRELEGMKIEEEGGAVAATDAGVLDDQFLSQEHQLLYYGRAQLPSEGGYDPGSAKARVYAVVSLLGSRALPPRQWGGRALLCRLGPSFGPPAPTAQRRPTTTPPPPPPPKGQQVRRRHQAHPHPGARVRRPPRRREPGDGLCAAGRLRLLAGPVGAPGAGADAGGGRLRDPRAVHAPRQRVRGAGCRVQLACLPLGRPQLGAGLGAGRPQSDDRGGGSKQAPSRVLTARSLPLPNQPTHSFM
jgi:hypothetical protein